MKSYSVVVTFPEVASAYAQQRITVNASNFETAIARAVRTLRTRGGIKGKHVTIITATAHVLTEVRACQDSAPEKQKSATTA